MVANLSIDNMTLTSKRRIGVANGLTFDATTLQLHNLTARIRSLLHQHPNSNIGIPAKAGIHQGWMPGSSPRAGCHTRRVAMKRSH